MGLLNFLSQSLKDSHVQPTFMVERCLRSRLNTNQCQRCVLSCPTGALKIIKNKINLETPHCSGCMSCVAICPQDALVSNNEIADLLDSLKATKDAVISCNRHPQNFPDEIAIPCVGIVSKPLLAAIVLKGCRSVTFELSGCTDCCNEDVSLAFRLVCKELLEELKDLQPSSVVLNEKRKPLAPHDMDRRSYLSKIQELTVGIVKSNLSRPIPYPDVEPKKSRRIPFKTELIKKVHASLDGDAQKKIVELFCHKVSFHEECNCCPLCKGICPTGAIKIERSTQGKKIKFEMFDCSGCGLCVEFCRSSAVSMIHL